MGLEMLIAELEADGLRIILVDERSVLVETGSGRRRRYLL